MIDGDALLSELERVTYAQVTKQYSEAMAIKCCNAMCHCLHLNFNTRSMYITKTDKSHLKEDYETIFSDFKNRNYKELALKYHRSEQSIYHIIKACTHEHVRHMQSNLFPLPDIKEKKSITELVVEQYLPPEFIACGLSEEHAAALAQLLSQHLTLMFPGISVVISHRLLIKHQRDERQRDLFDG